MLWLSYISYIRLSLTQFCRSFMFATKHRDTPENTNPFTYTKQTGKTFQPTRTRQASNILLFFLDPPRPRSRSHKTEPDYDSLVGLCRSLLLFSAQQFTPIIYEPKAASGLWNLSRHMPSKAVPQLQSEGPALEFEWIVWISLGLPETVHPTGWE